MHNSSGRSMIRKIKHKDEPLGDVEIILDSLPRPEEIVSETKMKRFSKDRNMAGNAKKTEHAEPKRGLGAYWGRKAGKRESNKVRRESAKRTVRQGLTDLEG